MSTTTGDQNGTPLFGLFDEEGLKDATKFFNFAKSKDEGSFTAIFGNEAMEHWFTVNIFRNENGETTYYCCDSLGENHSVTGLYSPLGKMFSLLENELSQPDEFLRKSFESIGNELSTKAGWISYSGEISEDDKNMLLDGSPNTLLAVPGISNGSPRDQLIHKCLSSFEMMEKCGWLESTNIEQQNHVNNLTKLLTFLRENLDENSPHMPSIIKTLESIEVKRNHEYVNQALKEALNDFESLKNPTILAECELAQTTFKQIFSEFAKKSAEELRETDRKSLQTSLIAYQKAKQKGLLKEFIEEIANGDRSLNARFERIEGFMEAKLMGLDLEEDTRKDEIFMLSDRAIGTAFCEIAPDGDFDSITPDTLLKNEEHMQALVSSFEQFQDPEIDTPFKELLEQKGLVKSTDNINWGEIMPSLVQAPFFPECLDRGKQLFLNLYFY